MYIIILTPLFCYLSFSCQCDSSNVCLETGTSNPSEVPSSEDVRICLLSSGMSDILDLDFFQLTLTDPLGDESTIPIIVEGISINPAASFEISEDGQSAVIIISNDLFDPGKFLCC